MIQAQNTTERKILARSFKKISIYHTADKFDCMHNKFYIFSDNTVVTGSYNNTTQARNNEENIVIFKDADLAQSYLTQFNHIVNKCNTPNFAAWLNLKS